MSQLSISSVENTESFVGPAASLRQVLRVGVHRRLRSPGVVEVEGLGVAGHVDLPAGAGEVVVEVPLDLAGDLAAGLPLTVLVTVRGARQENVPGARCTAEVVVAEPGR